MRISSYMHMHVDNAENEEAYNFVCFIRSNNLLTQVPFPSRPVLSVTSGLSDRIGSVAGTNFMLDERGYDDWGSFNNTEKIVELGQKNIKISLARLKYRNNCVRIKRDYILGVIYEGSHGGSGK